MSLTTFCRNSVSIKLSLSFPKLSWAHSQPFSAYSYHNTNIHYLAYTFLLHKRPITDQRTVTLSETLGLFTTLLVVLLSSSSPLIIFSPHSSNLKYSFPPFTQSQPINVSQLVINSPPLTKSLNLSVNPISLTQNSPHYLIHALCAHTHQNLSLIFAALSWELWWRP